MTGSAPAAAEGAFEGSSAPVVDSGLDPGVGPGETVARVTTRRRLLWRYALIRVAVAPIGVLALVAASFFLVNLVPSNPGREVLGSEATAAQVHQFDVKIGWDEPVLTRFWHYLDGIAHGTLGASYITQQSVGSAIAQHLPNTIELIIPSLLVALVLGVGFAVVSARVRSRRGKLANLAITVLQSLPDFVIAVILIYLLFTRLHAVPAPTGQLSFADTPPPTRSGILFVDTLLAGDWSLLGSVASHAYIGKNWLPKPRSNKPPRRRPRAKAPTS